MAFMRSPVRSRSGPPAFALGPFFLPRRDAGARQPPAQLARGLVCRGAVEGHERSCPAWRADELSAPAISVDRLCLDDVGTAIDCLCKANRRHGPPGAREE